MEEKMRVLEEIRKTQEQLRQAQQNFNYAEPKFIELAILELNYNEDKLGLLNRIARKELSAS